MKETTTDKELQPVLINKKEIYKRLLVLAIPIALQNLLAALLNIVDSVMVQSLGDSAMGAVLLVNQYIFIYQIIVFSISGAAVVFISQYYGKGELDKIPPCFTLAFIFVLSFGIIFTIISYLAPTQVIKFFFTPESDAVLQEAGKFLKVVAWSFIPFGLSTLIGMSLRGFRCVLMPLIVSASVITVNIFFNYVFMFGKLGFPNLAIAGAGLGTTIARAVECIVIIIVVIVKKYPIVGKLKTMFAISKEYVVKFLKICLPALGNELSWVLGSSMFLNVFAGMNDSESVLAAVNMVQAIEKIAFVVLIGVGTAAGIVVGNELGADNKETAKSIAKLSLMFSTLCGVGVAILTCLSGFLLPVIYAKATPQSISTAKNLLIIFGISMIIRARTFALFVGLLRAGGDAVYSMVSETLCVWLLGVPLAFILGSALDLSVEIVYIGIYFQELVKMLIVTFRFNSGKWIKNVIHVNNDENADENDELQQTDSELLKNSTSQD